MEYAKLIPKDAFSKDHEKNRDYVLTRRKVRPLIWCEECRCRTEQRLGDDFLLHAYPQSKAHLTNVTSFFFSVLSCPKGCIHFCGRSFTHLPSFSCTSCGIFVTASVLLCGPSSAAPTLSQFCPTIRRRKSHFLHLPKDCFTFGRLSPLLLSFCSQLFLSEKNQPAMNCSQFFHHSSCTLPSPYSFSTCVSSTLVHELHCHASQELVFDLVSTKSSSLELFW